MFAEMDRSLWLWVLPLLVVMRYGGYLLKSRRLSRFITPGLWSQMIPDLSSVRRVLKVVWVVLGMLFVILAYMQPQFGQIEQTVVHEGSHVVIAVDISKSMLAEDLAPSRLDYAKREIKSFIDQSQGDKIGLVVFSGNAFVHCPFTTDYEALKLFVDDIRTGMIPRQGTNLAAAIRKSRDMIGPDRYDSGVMVIFSDGEHFEGNPVRSAEVAGDVGVPIYMVGLGTEVGRPIPLKDASGALLGYKKDREGQVVLSRLNQSVIKSVATVASGRAFFISDNRGVADDLYKVVSAHESVRLSEKRSSRKAEQYQWFLALGFFFLVLDLGFSAAKRQVATVLVILFLGVGVSADMGLSDYRQFQSGNRHLVSGQPEFALSEYIPLKSKGLSDAALSYNLGMAFYKQGDFDQAEPLLKSAVLERPDLAKDVAFQLAGMAYQKGDYQGAVSGFSELVSRYPDWEAPRHNLELALQKLQAQQQSDSQSEEASEQGSSKDSQDDQGQGDESREGRDAESEEANSQGPGDEKAAEDGDNQSSLEPKEKASEQVVQQFLSTLDQQEAAAREQYQRRFTEGGGQVSHDW